MCISRTRSSDRRLIILLILGLICLGAALTRQITQVETAPAITPIESSSEVMITRLQERIRQNPTGADAYAQLGLAYLQQVRESGDAALYLLAEKAFAQALAHDPGSLDALIGQGILALARHDFAGAIGWAEQARTINPFRAQIVGILVDAQVELGRYEEAVQTAQAMVDLRPDLPSYTRVSYVRELHGDTEGAIAAMAAAVAAGVPGTEQTAWTQVQLGHLHFNQGDFDAAEAIYEETLYFRPDYPYALAGLGRVQAVRGEYEAAIAIYQPLVEQLPLPEFAITLGELYEVTGQLAAAQRQYDTVRVIQQLNAEAGMNVDLELALFEADQGGHPAQTAAQARAAYERRPSIYAADVLAWALYQNGDLAEAWAYSQEALRLGTQDALLHYHAGMIALALAETEVAQAHLTQAQTINPAFSIRYAAVLEETLAQLSRATN